jgi:hypothetical protein
MGVNHRERRGKIHRVRKGNKYSLCELCGYRIHRGEHNQND